MSDANRKRENVALRKVIFAILDEASEPMLAKEIAQELIDSGVKEISVARVAGNLRTMAQGGTVVSDKSTSPAKYSLA